MVTNNSRICRSVPFEFAWYRCDFTSKALHLPGKLVFHVGHDSMILKPFKRDVVLGSAVKQDLKSSQKPLELVKEGKGKTCTSGSQHLSADQSSYCTCQQCRRPDASPVSLASLWPIHPHFKVNATTPTYFPPSPLMCWVFKQNRSMREKWPDATGLWWMVPHWGVGKRIYGEGRMLLLNLRKGSVHLFCMLPLSFWNSHFLFSFLCFAHFLSAFVLPLCLPDLLLSRHLSPLVAFLFPFPCFAILHLLLLFTPPYICGLIVQHNCQLVHLQCSSFEKLSLFYILFVNKLLFKQPVLHCISVSLYLCLCICMLFCVDENV